MKEQCIASKRSTSANKGNCNKKNYGYFKSRLCLLPRFFPLISLLLRLMFGTVLRTLSIANLLHFNRGASERNRMLQNAKHKAEMIKDLWTNDEVSSDCFVRLIID